MYYIEFFSKKEGVPLERFYKEVREGYEQWMKEHPDDELVLLIGRTWRLGPEPNYMAVWKVKDFARFDEWKKHMPGPEEIEKGAQIIEFAGTYEEFGEEQL